MDVWAVEGLNPLKICSIVAIVAGYIAAHSVKSVRLVGMDWETIVKKILEGKIVSGRCIR